MTGPTDPDTPDPTDPEATEPEAAAPAPDAAAPVSAQRAGRRRKVALSIGLVVALAIVGTLGWFWKQSLVPDTYSVMSMGYHDYGGGPVPDSLHGSSGDMGDMGDMGGMDHSTMGQDEISVADLTGPSGQPDVAITLTAREETVDLAGEGDRSVDGITLNHQSPGPLITARAGDLVEVSLVNASVDSGITLHWHGVDVPNAEDGVAGVTQDAVQQGDDYVYRFVVKDPGTYWYHSHQVSDEEVSKGLLGPLVVLPKDSPDRELPEHDVVATVHTYDGNRTVNGVVGTEWIEAEAGDSVRVRVINTNDGPLRTWVTGSSYALLSVDGRDLNRPPQVTGQTVVVPAGGRADLVVETPGDGTASAVNFGGGTRVAIGPEGANVVEGDDPEQDLDLLSYGEPEALPFDPADADRQFTYSIGRRLAFLDGKPGFWWTINGHLYPDVPMFVVEEGDLVVMTIENHSGQVHPMHLHGHHAVVLSRDGEPATGSPWWIDSLDVQDGETYDIAFVADNPGVWMDHCHNLPHASQGLVTHLMYAGVTTPYVVGGDSDNDPE